MRCRYCFKEGHNVKSCEALTKEVKDNPSGYYYCRYKKYFNPDGSRKKASVVKKCSYCDTHGHTKRTCLKRTDDLVANTKTDANYRKDAYYWLKGKGLGVGSLVSVGGYQHLYLISRINWDNITLGYRKLSPLKTNHHISIMPVSGSPFYTGIDLDPYTIINESSLRVESPQYEIPKPSEKWFKGNSESFKDYVGLCRNPFDTTINFYDR